MVESAESKPRTRLPRGGQKMPWQLFTELSNLDRPLDDCESCDEASKYLTDLLDSAAF